MRLKYASSTDAAAAFIARREARKRRRKTERRGRPLPPEAPVVEGDDTMLRSRWPRVRLPPALYRELLDHCHSFGITPKTFIEKMLMQAKLSRGGT